MTTMQNSKTEDQSKNSSTSSMKIVPVIARTQFSMREKESKAK